MPKLYSSSHIITVLLKHGFHERSRKGSHVKLSSGGRIVVVPDPRKEIP